MFLAAVYPLSELSALNLSGRVSTFSLQLSIMCILVLTMSAHSGF